MLGTNFNKLGTNFNKLGTNFNRLGTNFNKLGTNFKNRGVNFKYSPPRVSNRCKHSKQRVCFFDLISQMQTLGI